MAEIGGDKGDWSMVRSRKRKATEPDYRGQHRSREAAWQGGAARVYGQDRRSDATRVFRYDLKDNQQRVVHVDGRASNFHGSRVSSSEWHGTVVDGSTIEQGRKAAFYVTNFPDNLPLFRLRQAFEVCGI